MYMSWRCFLRGLTKEGRPTWDVSSPEWKGGVACLLTVGAIWSLLLFLLPHLPCLADCIFEPRAKANMPLLKSLLSSFITVTRQVTGPCPPARLSWQQCTHAQCNLHVASYRDSKGSQTLPEVSAFLLAPTL